MNDKRPMWMVGLLPGRLRRLYQAHLAESSKPEYKAENVAKKAGTTVDRVASRVARAEDTLTRYNVSHIKGREATFFDMQFKHWEVLEERGLTKLADVEKMKAQRVFKTSLVTMRIQQYEVAINQVYKTWKALLREGR